MERWYLGVLRLCIVCSDIFTCWYYTVWYQWTLYEIQSPVSIISPGAGIPWVYFLLLTRHVFFSDKSFVWSGEFC